MSVCTLCLHEHTPGTVCEHTEDLSHGNYGRCLCTGPMVGKVIIKIPEDLWNFYSGARIGFTGEETIEKVLRNVMGIFL